MEYTLAKLAERFDLSYGGAADIRIIGVCGLTDNLPDRLSFVTDDKHLSAATQAAMPAFVTRPGISVPGKANLHHPEPDLLMAQIAALFAPSQLTLDDVHASAVVAGNAVLGEGVSLGANVVVGQNVTIGRRTRIYPNVVIMDRVSIGDDCVIYPNCTLREDCELGARVILQPGVSIGGDGYGYATVDAKHIKIPQIGRVVIEDDVEIGANSTVDRARFSETRIGRGTKIDNLVMVAHNVVTGEDCLLVSQVGVSGSTRLGDRVVLAGQVGTVGHVTVADDVTVLGKGGITKNVSKAGVYAGMPLKPARLWRRAMARLYAGLK